MKKKIENEDESLRVARKMMRNVETLAYISAFIGILFFDANADVVDARLRLLVENSEAAINAVHQDKDVIIERLKSIQANKKLVSDYMVQLEGINDELAIFEVRKKSLNEVSN